MAGKKGVKEELASSKKAPTCIATPGILQDTPHTMRTWIFAEKEADLVSFGQFLEKKWLSCPDNVQVIKVFGKLHNEQFAHDNLGWSCI